MRETEQSLLVATCVNDGAPLMGAELANGYFPCPVCGRVMHVKVRNGKVSVTDASAEMIENPVLRILGTYRKDLMMQLEV